MKPFSIEERNRKITELDSIANGDFYNDPQFFDDFLNINSINLDLSEELYRIIDWKYFIEDLQNKKLTLVRTVEWEDPFENFMLNVSGQYRGRNGNLSNLRDSYFVSCWSLKPECDGLWRNYHKKRRCVVKVKTNAKKLFASIYNFNSINHDTNYFIGKVKYVNDNFIVNKLKRIYNINELDDGIIFIEQLFMKRKPFAYEKEVRAIIHDENYSINRMKIPIDPNMLIDEIVLDPWIKLSTFNRKKREIQNAGYTGSIIRSSLYDKTSDLILKIK